MGSNIGDWANLNQLESKILVNKIFVNKILASELCVELQLIIKGSNWWVKH